MSSVVGHAQKLCSTIRLVRQSSIALIATNLLHNIASNTKEGEMQEIYFHGFLKFVRCQSE